MTTPLIGLDVDGVLNVDASAKQRKRLVYHHGYRQKKVDLPQGQFRLCVNPGNGLLLQRLAAETGAELAWATTWQEYANAYVGPLVGLPPLPVAPVLYDVKALRVIPWAAPRPLVWFDDDAFELEVAAAYAAATGTPFCPVLVDEHTGLTPEHAATAREWLLGLPKEQHAA